MDEEPNGGESVGMKRRHKENDEDDSAEINGAYKKKKVSGGQHWYTLNDGGC